MKIRKKKSKRPNSEWWCSENFVDANRARNENETHPAAPIKTVVTFI